MGTSLYHSFTQYLVIRGAAVPLTLNNLIIEVVSGRCYETTLSIIEGERAMFHLTNPAPFLEAMKFSVQFNYHQQIFIYSLDEYLLSAPLSSRQRSVTETHRRQKAVPSNLVGHNSL